VLLSERGPQGFVAVNDVCKTRLQDLDVEGAADPKPDPQVIGGGPGLPLLVQPQPLLTERRRKDKDFPSVVRPFTRGDRLVHRSLTSSRLSGKRPPDGNAGLSCNASYRSGARRLRRVDRLGQGRHVRVCKHRLERYLDAELVT